jgi:hypothetical protein
MKADEFVRQVIQEKNYEEVASICADLFFIIIYAFFERGYNKKTIKEILLESLDKVAEEFEKNT